MNKTIIFLASSFVASVTNSAVLPVLSDGSKGSIQENVDLAQPGDIIAIFGGTYSGDVTVNKAVRLVEVDGQEVELTGNVMFTGITDAPPFEGFKVGSPGKGLTIAGTDSITLKDLDLTAGTGLQVNGPSVVNVVGGSYSSINQDGGELSAVRANVTGDFATTVNCARTVALQAQIGGSYFWRSAKCWLGYSTGRRFEFGATGGKAVIVGSEFVVNTTWTGVAVVGTNNHLEMVNSIVRDVVFYSYKPSVNQLFAYGHCVFVGAGNSVFLVNNYLHGRNTGNQDGQVFNNHNSTDTMAVGIYSQSSSVTSMNNIICGMSRGVNMPFGVVFTNNLIHGVWKSILGGVVESDTVFADPLFVAGQTPQLQASSPAIDAGVGDPILNDLDGTRNDIGPLGGALFDPDGGTTQSPVVISFELAPQQLLKGVDVEVQLLDGVAIGQR